jgi:peptide/nickel transport system substrate-binding protein
VCAVLAACGRSTAPDADASYLTVAVGASPASLDPQLGADDASRRVHQLVYSPLMALDERRHVVPHLAVRLDNPDPLTYVARLRSGVRFHDGHELTARDVVYTFDRLLESAVVPAPKDSLRVVASVTAVGEYAVEFKLKEALESFPSRLAIPVVPAEAGDALRTFPIGTGPYRFVRHSANERVVLSAFEGYWDGLPQNAGVVLTVIPDQGMRELELRQGTVDLIVDDTATWPGIRGARLAPRADLRALKDIRKAEAARGRFSS